MAPSPVVPDSEYLFRLLTWPDRECCAAVLRRLHERAHGPDADYSEVLTRERVISIALQVLGESLYRDGAFEPGEPVTPEAERAAASRMLLELKQQGWLAERVDPANLQPRLQLTATGQVFAAALSRLRSSPRAGTRQRHLRAATKALTAFLGSQDVDELLDCEDHVGRVAQDLQDDIDHFRGLIQSLTRAALEEKVELDELSEFVERRFAREYPARQVVDAAERRRSQVLQMLERVRTLAPPQMAAADAALLQQAAWLEAEVGGSTPVQWLCDRIEATLEAACGLKLPLLRREMDQYVKRFTGLLRQALSLDHSAQSPLSRCTARLKKGTRDEHDALLDALGGLMGTTEVRLPAGSVRWQAPEPSSGGLPSEPAAASLRVGELQILALLSQRCGERSIRLSDLPARNALDVMVILNAVNAARSAEGSRHFETRKLPARFETDYFVTSDYEFVPRRRA
jgi:hypothetical protein